MSHPASMHIVLIEPEIPQNTGSIGRLCAGTDTPLHLVGELGFSLADRYLKRAGLDYWPHVTLHRHASVDAWLEALGDAPLWLFSARAERCYADVRYGPEDHLVFGRESVGLPGELQERFAARRLRVPILDTIRSLNIANAASVVLFEALRQHGFPGRRAARTSCSGAYRREGGGSRDVTDSGTSGSVAHPIAGGGPAGRTVR